MRKIEGTAAATPFGGGHRLTLRSVTGEQVCMDLSAEASAALAGQLKPGRRAPAPSESSSAAQSAESQTPPPARRR